MGSLFAGIGGFDLGFERAGFRVLWQVEREPFCQKVLTKRFGVPIYDDVTTLEDAPPVDVLVGGFPCQDVSVAGKRAGLAGERSSLFWEFLRIADRLQPDWCVIENVPGLLTSRHGRDFHTVLSALADRGWRRTYRILDSQYFGVAQRRRRVFIVGHRGTGHGCPEAVLFEPASRSRDSQTREQARARVAATLRGRSHRTGVNMPGRGGEDDQDQFQVGPQSPTLSNGQTPAILNRERAHTLVGSMHKRHDDDTDTLIVAATLNSGGNAGGFRTEPGEHLVCGTLTAAMERAVHNGQDDHSDLLIAWNGDTTPKTGVDICPTLRAEQGGEGVGVGVGVRRLTPMECERLQGFPDGWTCLCNVTPYSTAGCTCSDSPRYRALGNAVTVNVAEWIARRLMAVCQERVA